MLNGWTSDLLKAREAREITAGGFGLGLLEDPPNATSANTPLFEPPPVPQHAQFTPTQATVHPIPTGGTPMGFAQLFETVTRDLLLAATRVVHMARENCTQAYGDHNLERVAEASQLLLGVLQHEPKATYATIADDPHTPGQTSMDHEEAFWQDPENIRALERAKMAAIRATTIDNMPSFSLGFTQDEPTQGDERPITPRAEMAAIRATTIDDMPSFSLGFMQGDPTQGDEGLITPIVQVANRVVQLGPLRGHPTIPIPPIYMVWMWVFNCPNTNRDEVLFRHKDRTAKCSDFRTLKKGVNISPAVVDAWATILNAREKSRKLGTPFRLFASTTTTVCTVVATTGSWDERIRLFKARLAADFQASEHVGTATLDMDGHFYVMSINFKQYKCDILHCSSKQMPNDEKYRDAPVDLLDMFSEYLESKHQMARSIRVRSLRP
nr:uncharacterized protein LOC109168291 [Ipomoea batatas]